MRGDWYTSAGVSCQVNYGATVLVGACVVGDANETARWWPLRYRLGLHGRFGSKRTVRRIQSRGVDRGCLSGLSLRLYENSIY